MPGRMLSSNLCPKRAGTTAIVLPFSPHYSVTTLLRYNPYAVKSTHFKMYNVVILLLLLLLLLLPPPSSSSSSSSLLILELVHLQEETPVLPGSH